jgi:hypothetical protein
MGSCLDWLFETEEYLGYFESRRETRKKKRKKSSGKGNLGVIFL